VIGRARTRLLDRVRARIYSSALAFAAQGVSLGLSPGLLTATGRHPAVLVPLSDDLRDVVLTQSPSFLDAMSRTDAEAASGTLVEVGDALAEHGLAEQDAFEIKLDVHAPLETVTACYLAIGRDPLVPGWLDKSAHADIDMHERSVVFHVAAPVRKGLSGVPSWVSRSTDVRIVMHETKHGGTQIVASGVPKETRFGALQHESDLSRDLRSMLDRLKIRIESAR
jgi:hypothetical protein